MSDASQNKAKEMRIVKVWCDKCRASMKIITPRDKEARCCPVCRRKLLIESIRYA